MGYNQQYSKLLQDRKPFQIAKSNEIRERNTKHLIQKEALEKFSQKRALDEAEIFISKICKMN